MATVPCVYENGDLFRRPCGRDVPLEPLQAATNFMKLLLGELAYSTLGGRFLKRLGAARAQRKHQCFDGPLWCTMTSPSAVKMRH
jgi:hypothetical protein